MAWSLSKQSLTRDGDSGDIHRPRYLLSRCVNLLLDEATQELPGCRDSMHYKDITDTREAHLSADAIKKMTLFKREHNFYLLYYIISKMRSSIPPEIYTTKNGSCDMR